MTVYTRTNVPTPTPGATVSTMQVGTYNAVTDTWTLVLDINDYQTWWIGNGSMKLDQPTKADSRSFNIRTPGERITRVQYKNRHIMVSLNLRGASTAAMLASIRALLSAIETPPYTLRIALPGATQYTYADVVRIKHNIPSDPLTILAKAIPKVTVDFECQPFFRGDRLTFQNLVTNPGFEAPAGGTGYTQASMPLAFNDPFNNVLAYTTVSGGAMTTAPANTYPDIVFANTPASSLVRYYRLDEASGTNVYDIAGTGATGTTHGSPTQGTTGLISGDTDKAYTFAAASSQYVSIPGTGLPSGNAAITIVLWLQIAANPASSQVLFSLGDGTTAHKGFDIDITSTGHITVDVGASTGTVTSTSAITTGAAHMAAITWDGTTLTLYVDGAATGTATTPGAQTVAASPPGFIGCLSNTTLFASAIIDEVAVWNTSISSADISGIYTAGHSGATGTLANAASVPLSGISSFGSPVWGGTTGVQQWQCRFRWVTSLTAVFYLHRTDANNAIKVFADGTNLTLYHSVTGTNHQLAQAAATLTHEAYYWLQITQFPTFPGGGDPPFLQATLLYDNNGAVGTQIAQIGASAFDGVTAMSGVCMFGNSGAALVIGGVASGAGNQVQLFAPGGWTFSPAIAPQTGQASGAWDTTPSHTFPNGPVTSFASARIDIPPGGTVDARWGSNGLSLASTGIPVRTGGDTLAVSAQYMTNLLLSANAVVSLHCNFYSSAFAFISSADAATASGVQSSWAQLSGTVVTPGTAAYMQLDLRVLDTTVAGESAGASVWFDDVQVWNQTQCAMSGMPYSELRFMGGPAQLMVSGIQGDAVVPVIAALGTFNKISGADNVQVALARRAQVSANAQLVGMSPSPIGISNGNISLVLDPKSLNGYYGSSTGTIGTSAIHTTTLSGFDVKDYQGVYHLFWRFQSAQSSGNLPNVTVAAQLEETIPGPATSTPLYTQPSVAPLAASSTWTNVDAGQVTFPLTGDAGVRDQTQVNEVLQLFGADSSGGGPAAQAAGWSALLPVDGSLWMATVYNGGTIFFGGAGGGWTWLYVMSTPSGAASQPTASAGWNNGNYYASFAGVIGQQPDLTRLVSGVGKNAFPDGVNPVADPFLTLDPTQPMQIAGNPVNQFVGYFVDAAGTQGAMPVCAEFYYSPNYLYPR